MNAPLSQHPLRLLIVDPDEPIQLLLAAVFRRRDAVVDCVSDVETALVRLGGERYDVLILDLMLPGSSGFDLIRSVQMRHPELLSRTIVLTAATPRMAGGLIEQPLVRRVMRKPFELADLIDEVLACRRSAPDASVQLPSEAPDADATGNFTMKHEH